MLHDEWKGRTKLIRHLIEQAGLSETKNEGEQKFLMRYILTCKYIELMTVDECLSSLLVDYEIEMSPARYYRILNKAVKLIEKWA